MHAGLGTCRQESSTAPKTGVMCVVQEEAVVYEWSAVSNHIGRTLAEGHYTADCKLPNGSWHRSQLLLQVVPAFSSWYMQAEDSCHVCCAGGGSGV